MVTDAEKSVWPVWTSSVPTTADPTLLLTVSARPLPYWARVVHHEELLGLHRVLDVCRGGRTLARIVAEVAEERRPVMSGQAGFRSRSSDRGEPALRERRVDRVGLTRERGPDHADHLRVADSLPRQRPRLGGVALRVVVDLGHLAARAGLVVLVHGQRDALLDVDAKAGRGASQGAEEPDLEVACGGRARGATATAAPLRHRRCCRSSSRHRPTARRAKRLQPRQTEMLERCAS